MAITRNERVPAATDPEQAKVLRLLGLVAQLRGDRVKARSHFLASLRFDDTDAHTWHSLGLLELEDGDERGAELHFRRALLENPKLDAARDRLDVLTSRRAS